MPPEDQLNASDLPDRLDEALEQLWQGQAGDLSRLIDEGDVSPAGGGLFEAVGQWRDYVPGILPDRIAGYEIVRELGRGGMGVVYEARQQNPHRLVALKLIHPRGRTDPLHTRLFQREVETLARLRHPGIASIYSAETSEDGCPFYVMELVQGEPLLAYANSSPLGPAESADDSRLTPLGQLRVAAPRPPLSTRERLQLFGHVCDAISYAHQRGVIHRDLKPSNIMVGIEPTSGGSSTSPHPGVGVKVLDFGLAHLTDTDASQTALLTQTGRIVGTLAYMSPEQARGDTDSIDLRTDVYALGVILYELLTGQLPYSIHGAAPHRAPSIICTTPPSRPSTINRALRGELETILLKALAKEPQERYQSAAALAEDLRRYLAGAPILACPPSTWYQLRKLIGRHKTIAALAAATFLVVTALAVVATTQARRAAEERDRARTAQAAAESARDVARAEAEKARRVQTFLQDILGSVDPDVARGRDVETLRELLAAAERRMRTELADEPDVAGAVRSTLGRTYLGLGLYAEAEPHLLAAIELAEAGAADGPARDNSDRLATALDDLGRLYQRRTQDDQAVACFLRALDIRRRMLLVDAWTAFSVAEGDNGAMIPADIGEDHVEWAVSYGLLGRHKGSIHAYDVALAYLERALALRQRDLGADDPLTLRSLDDLAWLQARRGENKAAEPMLREVLAAYRRLYGEDHPDTAAVMHNLAAALKANGKYPEAEQVYAEAIEIQRRVMGPEHASLASVLVSRADLLKMLGRLDEAASLLGEALPIQIKHLGTQNDDVAATLAEMGSVQIARGDFTGGEEKYREALEMYRALHGDRHTAVLICQNAIATILVRTQRYAEAETLFREILVSFRELHGEEHPGYAVFKANLSHVLTLLGELEEAEALCREVLEFRRRTLGEEHPQVGMTLHTLAGILQAAGRLDESRTTYEDAIALHRLSKGDRHTDLGNTLTKYGTLLQELGDVEGAAAVFAEAYDIHSAAHEVGHPSRSSTTTNFGRLLVQESRYTDPRVAECVLREYGELAAARPDTEGLCAEIDLARGEAWHALGDDAAAEVLLLAAYRYFREHQGIADETTQRAVAALAAVYATMGDEARHAEFARMHTAPATAAD